MLRNLLLSLEVGVASGPIVEIANVFKSNHISFLRFISTVTCAEDLSSNTHDVWSWYQWLVLNSELQSRLKIKKRNRG